MSFRQVFPSLNNTVKFGSGKNATTINTTMDMFLAKARALATPPAIDRGGSVAPPSDRGVRAIDRGKRRHRRFNISSFLTAPVSPWPVSPTHAQANSNGTLLWTRTYGGATADDSGLNIAPDCNTGSVVITGSFSSNPSTFGTSPVTGLPIVLRPGGGNSTNKDGFVLRVNAAGATEWVYTISGSDAESVLGVAVDAATGDAVVTGQSCSQSLTFGASADVVMPNLPSFDRISGSQLCDKSTSNSFIARISAAGSLLWVSPFTGSGDVSGQDVAISPTGEIIAAGYFRGFSASFGHYNPAASSQRGPAISPVASSGDVSAIALTSSNIGSDAQAFVVKASATGSMLWALDLGNDQALGVSVDSTRGTVMVSGTLGSAPSYFPVPGGGMPIRSRGGKDTWVAQVYLCATGQFLNSSGCFLCIPGYYCPGSAATVPCGMNKYCPLGAAQPIACPIGQLTLTNTSSSCVFAPPPPSPPPPQPPMPPPLRGSGSGVAAGIGIAIGCFVAICCLVSCVVVYHKKQSGRSGVPLSDDTSGIAMAAGGAGAAGVNKQGPPEPQQGAGEKI